MQTQWQPALMQLASERGQRESNQLAERHQKMLRELHEATAAAAALKADNAEKAKQLQLREDALKSARSEASKVRAHDPCPTLNQVWSRVLILPQTGQRATAMRQRMLCWQCDQTSRNCQVMFPLRTWQRGLLE